MPPSPLTIIHVVFSSRIAGGEQYCIDLAHAQAALGHRVHVIGPSRSQIPAVLDDKVSYHGLALPLLRSWRVHRLAQSLGADVVHGHLGPACKATARSGAPAKVGTLHVGYKPHQHAALDGLVCVNQSQPSQLQGFDGRHKVIHNWAPARSTPQSDRGLRDELGLHAGQLLIGCLGRLHSSKGTDLLVKAFRQYAPDDAVLAIIGEGKQRAELERLAAGDKRIHLVGYRRDVPAVLDSLDLFVSPSREETFGLAILEAMQAGLPIISTATEGPLEVLRDQPAQLVPVNDAPALGRAVRLALAPLRGGLHGKRERVRYDTRGYDRAHAVRQMQNFYADLLTARVQTRTMPGIVPAHA
ncbi:MAG: glycosyltransferase family 4 protein [Paucibacter sp.]|nr:glycosyltransferase family 4 protein [Roseateles sp.]